MGEQNKDTGFTELAAIYKERAALLHRKLTIWNPWCIDWENEEYKEWFEQLTTIELAKHIMAIECVLIDMLNSHQAGISICTPSFSDAPHIRIGPSDSNKQGSSISALNISIKMSEFSDQGHSNSYYAWLGITTHMIDDPNLFNLLDYSVTVYIYNCESWLCNNGFKAKICHKGEKQCQE